MSPQDQGSECVECVAVLRTEFPGLRLHFQHLPRHQALHQQFRASQAPATPFPRGTEKVLPGPLSPPQQMPSNVFAIPQDRSGTQVERKLESSDHRALHRQFRASQALPTPFPDKNPRNLTNVSDHGGGLFVGGSTGITEPETIDGTATTWSTQVNRWPNVSTGQRGYF